MEERLAEEEHAEKTRTDQQDLRYLI